jgi:hypothetical protein
MLPLMILLTGCFGITVNSGSSGTVKITELVIAKDVTSDGNPIEPALEFNTNDKRIYCIVGVTGPEIVRIGSRWYFGWTWHRVRNFRLVIIESRYISSKNL